jgi:histidinol-phosphate/aromatic aminotransferase/cobyric acid decarboxylase-like protein
MDPYHDIHSWSRQYNEEMLREVRTGRLEKRLRSNGEVGKDGLWEGKGVFNMRRFVLLFAVAAIMVASVAFSAPAFASHEHYLSTPGTCVEDVAGGQTAKDEGEGGYHKFHDNVHKGQPGMAAFENPNNPVSVDKGTCPTQP